MEKPRGKARKAVNGAFGAQEREAVVQMHPGVVFGGKAQNLLTGRKRSAGDWIRTVPHFRGGEESDEKVETGLCQPVWRREWKEGALRSAPLRRASWPLG